MFIKYLCYTKKLSGIRCTFRRKLIKQQGRGCKFGVTIVIITKRILNTILRDLEGLTAKTIVFILRSPHVGILVVCPSSYVLSDYGCVPEVHSGSLIKDAFIHSARPGLHISRIAGSYLSNERPVGIKER